MSTDMTWQTTTDSVEQTLQLACDVGSRLRGGEVIELASDLGGGKTAFVRGLAKGMGSKDDVSSPSFTLTNQYRSDTLIMEHFDFYRLQEPGILRQELAEVIADAKTVTVIEWAAIVDDVLPVERLTIRITASGETSRIFDFSYPASLTYLMESIIS